MKNLLNEFVPTTPAEILQHAPFLPCNERILVAFSGGNDSRGLAHVAKQLFAKSPFVVELAAIKTGLQVDGWEQSIIDYASLIGLPVSFWEGEGREFYEQRVKEYGFPGNANHSIVQTRLKGRAYDKMYKAVRTDTEKPMADAGVAVWILSGIRKNESQKRMRLTSPYSYRGGVQFINPLFYWSNAQVIDYLIDNDLPLSPFEQGDCKCGASSKYPEHEWESIKNESPQLFAYLQSLENPLPWPWGCFDKSAHSILKQVEAGQAWLDDGSIAAFPTCLNCTRGSIADDESAMREW